jgi:hexokinase
LPEQALPWKTADMKILAVDIGGTFIKYAEVVACKYGNDANLVGALFTYMDSYADN